LKPPARRRITVSGIVQGVGFRPFVFLLANRHGLSGWVANSSHGVEIEVQGEEETLARFLTALANEAPAQALVTGMASDAIPAQQESGFTITLSADTGPAATLIAPDLALCADCLTELFDPHDRRHRYPFINCTQCGPRFTIIRAIPYDRPTTAMAPFTMCPACQAEYDDPLDRRFHAQPNACPACGPRVELVDHQGLPLAGDPVTQAAGLLTQGRILAIKGLGGFHLAVDADNTAAVQRLRERKGRPEKPLAIMVPDLATARRLCILNQQAENLLTSPGRPILLAPRREHDLISAAVSPGVHDLGLMLPYTPLHHLLLNAYPHPLVMTSANRSGEPILSDNQEAIACLGGVADAFLVHDRAILCRCDDSVVMMTHDRPAVLRRSRGQTPTPILVAGNGPQVLAVGGELKNTLCLLKGNHGFLSQHIGDLHNLATLAFFQGARQHLLTIFAGTPQLVVHDLHPGYLSSQWAMAENGLPTLAVQHHHAHLAACLAENRHPGPAIGIILDGTGYGSDHTIWGGEVLIGGFTHCERFAFLEPMPLAGGEAAIREPWRAAVGYLARAFAPSIPPLPFLASHPWQPVAEIAERGLNSPLTSSCGRLFDAVAAMAGGRQRISYEGQAAIALMHAAQGSLGQRAYAIKIQSAPMGRQMMVCPIIRQVAADVAAGLSLTTISQTLHRTLIDILTQAALEAANHSGLETVALSGGVFANHLLLTGLGASLAAAGLAVLSHSLIPAGDGGLALGQAMIGRHHLQANAIDLSAHPNKIA
jgi:hydrogenase maturation protein HypF